MVAAYRVGLAGLTIAAIATQLLRVFDRDASVANFFSFFTIQSNLLATVAFLWAAALAIRPATGRSPPALDRLRGAAVVYMVITGVVYELLLSDLPPGEDSTIPWVNTVVHTIMPIAVALDWVIDPPAARISTRVAAWWLAFPLAWTAYTLARGPLVDWYPYPFIDPRVHGALGVAGRAAAIAVGFVLVSALVAWIGNRRRA